MFLLFFTFFIIIYTVFENIFLLIAIFLLLVVVLYIVKLVKNIAGKKILKLFGFLVIALFTVIISVGRKNYRYSSISEQKYRNGTGVVESLYKHKTLILNTKVGDFFLKTSKSYKIGDEIFVSGIVRAAYTPKQLFDFSQQRDEFKEFEFFNDVLEYKFLYSRRLFMKGISADIYERNSLKISDENNNFIQNMRVGLYQKVNVLYGKNKYAGLILGMLIGDRYQIPQDSYINFQQSGLVHIIAVSGGNIMIIVIVLGFILFWIPFYFRKFVIGGMIIVYALVCGMDSSVIRATIMGLLGIIAIFSGRELSIYKSMKMAFLFMICYNPYFLVYDIGFILSFSAVIGILMFEKILSFEYQKNQNWKEKIKTSFQAMLYPTIGATLGVFPILLFYMGEFNLLGIVANIFVLPIVGIVMITAFVTSYLNALIPRTFWGVPITWLIKYIYKVSEIIGKWGMYINISTLWLKYFVLIGWIVFVVWFLFIGKDKKVYKEKEKRMV